MHLLSGKTRLLLVNGVISLRAGNWPHIRRHKLPTPRKVNIPCRKIFQFWLAHEFHSGDRWEKILSSFGHNILTEVKNMSSGKTSIKYLRTNQNWFTQCVLGQADLNGIKKLHEYLTKRVPFSYISLVKQETSCKAALQAVKIISKKRAFSQKMTVWGLQPFERQKEKEPFITRNYLKMCLDSSRIGFPVLRKIVF